MSYLTLRGRCHNCHAKIGARYLLLELVCGLLAPLLLWHFGMTTAFVGSLILVYALVAVVAIDFAHQIIPDDITLPLLWIGLMFNLSGTYCPLPAAVIGAVVGYGSLWLFYHGFKLVTGKEGMGYGDFKLFAMFGAWSGWQMLPLTILVASLIGSCTGLLLLAKRGESQPFAFGPYLALGGMLSFLYGQELLQWYLTMF